LQNASKRRALIVGGSMSGLLAALLLRRAGWAVDVFERVDSELAGRGAGIIAQPELIETLRLIGIDPTELGVEIRTRKMLDASGQLVGEFECPQVLTAWERVYRSLRDAFAPEHYHRGRGVQSFAQTERSVMAHLANGGSEEGDLLVGADGLRSTIRQQCLPELSPLYAGYVAWRALIPEAALPSPIHRELFNHMTFCLPPGEQCVGYPVAGPDNDLRPGHRRYNVVWYRPAEESTELKHLLTDESGTTHVISIPPPLIPRDAIAAMHAAAERLLAPQLRAAALHDETDVAAALRCFEAARLPVGRCIIDRARHLGAYLQATQTAEELARSRRHRIPEAVLEETGVLDFLRT
jgi:2-polyprenyl-6-methoxyphenol hydroxylase-like FAD-dependent oxidoreductase